MTRKHLDPRLFDKLMRGEISGEEARELALHLVECCSECARIADADWVVSEEPEALLEPATVAADGPPISFDRVRRRIHTTLVRLLQQKEEAPALLDELLRHPPERQRLLVRNNPRFQTVPLAELILERSWELGFQDVQAAEDLAEMALELVDVAEGGLVGNEVLNDLRGRAWAYRGNFRRIGSDFRGAEEAFRRADQLLAAGTGDVLEKARLFGLESSLCLFQLRLERARELIDKAIGIYLMTDEVHLAGRTMINQALLLKEEGEPARAIEVLQEALGMIDAEREPYLLLVARQNLVSYLAELGRYQEAMALVPKVRRHAIESGGRFDLLRVRWVEGRILLGLGHESRAEAAFLEVRKGFIEQGLGHDTAAVSLELAALYLRQGRTAELKELASEMLPIFRSRDVHSETMAALMLFKKAVEMETVNVRMVEEVADLLRRNKGRPQLQDVAPS